MNLALIGYGKMGKAIEGIALQRGHRVVLTIDLDNAADLNASQLTGVDAAIEFTGPNSAFDNVRRCLEHGTPVVCGSTGWLEKWPEIQSICESRNGALVYSSNYSIGVNLFFELNKRLAELMAGYPDYGIKLEETHHTQKKDAPSGTAVSLAEQILEKVPRKKAWVNHASDDPDQLEIISRRIDPAAGIHTVSYHSEIDDIEIRHTAHNRTGFATGAVMAAEFIAGRKGIFAMRDVLGL